MKTNSQKIWRKPLAAIGAMALLLLCAGCLEKRFVWSPDGAWAAVIGKDGLRICDANGKLSSVFVPDVYQAAWLGDSKQLVVARGHEVKDWNSVAKVLGPDAATIEKAAEATWQQLQSGTSWNSLHHSTGWGGDDSDPRVKSVTMLYLLDHHRAEFLAKLNEAERKEVESKTAQVSELVVARFENDAVKFGATLHEQLGPIQDIRPRSQGGFVEFTSEMAPISDDGQLLIVPVDGRERPTLVAKSVAAWPDWTADGRSVVYFESSTATKNGDQVSLGALVERQVIDDNNRIKLAEKPRYLAGAIFSGFARVRCLRDGRILFNATEITLPMAAEDYGDQHEQLFAVDLARQPTVVRLIPRKQEEKLPQALAFFEVSPDETQVLFGGRGNVAVLTLATGEVNEIQKATKDDDLVTPVWRMAGEVTYVKRSEKKDGKESPRDEIVLRRGETETVLSRSWSDEILESVLK